MHSVNIKSLIFMHITYNQSVLLIFKYVEL